jgi:hypothetical protein
MSLEESKRSQEKIKQHFSDSQALVDMMSHTLLNICHRFFPGPGLDESSLQVEGSSLKVSTILKDCVSYLKEVSPEKKIQLQEFLKTYRPLSEAKLLFEAEIIIKELKSESGSIQIICRCSYDPPHFPLDSLKQFKFEAAWGWNDLGEFRKKLAPQIETVIEQL